MASTDNCTPELLGHWGYLSLVAEARLTPKPGLVDQRTNGAHTDMDLSTFMASAQALEPHFRAYAETALRLGPQDPAALADALRAAGIGAEAAMFDATAGVNTHKGANFTFALVIGAVSALIASGMELPLAPADTQKVLALVSDMAKTLLDHDVRQLLSQEADGTRQLSHGERLYLTQGLKGVRGEAACGYPLLSAVLLPYLRATVTEPERCARMPLLRALVKLMAELEDTNVVHRGGMSALIDHRAFCRALDAENLPDEQLIGALIAYDDELIYRNVSPGGAADLLSLGVLFCLLEGVLTPQAIS